MEIRGEKMRYLIKYRKEFAISIGFFIMTAINLVKAVMSKDISEELIIAVIYAFFGVLAWFYHMPTSPEGQVGKEAILDMRDLANTEWDYVKEPEDSEVSEDDE